MDALTDLVGESSPVRAVREKIQRLLERQSDARRLPPILLQGETGTGKGLLARALHRASQRSSGPFVDVNCAAIPETLLEAEMFGFERGAFTDARQAKAGLFQTATNGSIFLDEVALLPEALQAKLLKVIEERTVRRLGSTRSEPIDVWIITGTNEDLASAARTRRFRDDLYHRLAVVTVDLPPLRERGDDILLLAEHFLAQACADYDLAPKALEASAHRALRAYRWPGNVRELANVMERVALLVDASDVGADMLGLPDAPPPTAVEPAEPPAALDETVEALQRQHLAEALEATRWNVSQAALRLGLSRNAVRWRIEKYGLRRGATRTSPSGGSARRSPPVVAASWATSSRALDPPPVPATVRWERRRVTVLRADLAPPAGQPLGVDVARHLPALLEKVQIFGGRVEDLSPTRLLAVFGLEPVEDAPRRAANAALAMRRAAERSHDEGAESPWFVKIALHIIEGEVGRVGSGALLDQDTKRLAWSRLEALIGRAESGEVVVSEAVAPFLERRFDFSRVEGAVTRLGGAERSGLGLGERMARFVGRERELDLLRSRYEAATSGRGQVVGIVGEAGIGKSRLLYEFRQELARQPTTCLEGHCLSYGGGIPYLPVLEILRSACGIVETDTPEAMRDKALDRFADVGVEADAVSHLVELLGLKSDHASASAVTPEVVKTRTFDALRQFVVKLSRQRALVIVVEDLHWADRTSEEFFSALADMVAGARMLLVCAYRPGYHPAWIEKSYATQVALQALATDDSREILLSLLDETTVTEPVMTLIVGKADGNPFFLEELARTVQERPDAASTLTVPGTVQEVLLARIDRLPVDDRRLLKSAAVIGKDVPLSLLRRITDASEETLLDRLRNLRDGEFLLETRLGSDVEYTFKHALTHDVAYASLLEGERWEIHARLVDVIEGLHAERLDEHVERLAHHAWEGQLWSKAVRYLRRAGERAATRSAHREAVAAFEAALAAIAKLPPTRELLLDGIDVRLALRSSLTPLGDNDAVLGYLREAEALARELEDEARLGWISGYLAILSWANGELDRAFEFGGRANTSALAVRDNAMRVLAATSLGMTAHSRGDYRAAVRAFRSNVDSITGELVRATFSMPQPASVHSRSWLASSLAELGEFGEAIEIADEADRIAASLDHPLSRAVAHAGQGAVHLRRGDIALALPVLELGLHLSRVWNIRLWLPRFTSSLGQAYALSGRIGEAIPLLEQAVTLSSAMKRGGLHAIWLTALGEGHALAGRPVRAIELAREALGLSRAVTERGHEAWALRLLGESLAAGTDGDLPDARACQRQALALAEELGMRPLAARCHLGLGKLYRRLGDVEAAERHRSTASANLHELGMRLWLAEAETERFL